MYTYTIEGIEIQPFGTIYNLLYLNLSYHSPLVFAFVTDDRHQPMVYDLILNLKDYKENNYTEKKNKA